MPPAEPDRSGRVQDRADRLAQLSNAFTFPVELADYSELPAWPRQRLTGGDEQAIVAERAGLQRALGNLLSNAGRYANPADRLRGAPYNAA